ncbi:poly(hydroxyalkanoate) granule-associated protein [Halospina denitrificans]|uniref:Poly(Hydroxyalkanoate) granule-associated protein n=1 Tax=Halospina denitrificans TaxID=332522 RepID=A0A4R7JT31_9GAMM|nr:phasin family protein [Halospina denitrificans]TDT41410.1 poly(hydroxyalkanoate) granule-associated protein [Halospina denitrificans]
MARKDENSEEQESDEQQQQLANRIKDSARQIWLAGLGAYTKAEEDTGKFFERLVQEGEDLENRTRGAVNRQVKAVEDRVGEVRERATGTWDRLESVFDERVSKALDRLGIPTPGRVRDLEQQVASLQEEMERLRRKLDDDK